MRKLFIFIFMAFAIHMNAQTLEWSNLYLEGSVGFNVINDHKKNGMKTEYNIGNAIGAKLGYKIFEFLNIEGELFYRTNSHDQIVLQDIDYLPISVSGRHHQFSTLANIIYETTKFNNNFTPYLGIGFGYGWNKDKFIIDPILIDGIYYVCKNNIKESSNGINYQAIVGMIFCRDENMNLSIDYRILTGVNTRFHHTGTINIKRFF